MDESVVASELLKAVYHYKISDVAKQVLQKSSALILCGVTASGKNTVASYLMSHSNYERVVTHTTRQPRTNNGKDEQNGIEYWFVTNQQMLNLVLAGVMVEVQAIHGDTFYGTHIDAIRSVIAKGKRPLLELDVQSAEALAALVPDLHPIFIMPPNYDIWMERLGTRGFMSDGEKERRLQSAKKELETAVASRFLHLMVNNEAEITATDIMGGITFGSPDQFSLRRTALELRDYLR
jgi:guanylate kinase